VQLNTLQVVIGFVHKRDGVHGVFSEPGPILDSTPMAPEGKKQRYEHEGGCESSEAAARDQHWDKKKTGNENEVLPLGAGIKSDEKAKYKEAECADEQQPA